MSSSTAGRFLDWNKKATPGWITATATTGALAAAELGHLNHMPWMVPAGVGAAGAIGQLIATTKRTHKDGKDVVKTGLAFRAACWLAGGGWTAFALGTGPWTWGNFGMLTAGSLVCWGLGARVNEAEEVTREVRVEMRRKLARDKKAAEWVDRIRRVCRIELLDENGDAEVGIEDWKSGTGYTVQLNLREGGESWEDIKRQAAALAADLDLPMGCGVDVAMGRSRRAVILRVSTVNVMGQDLPFPTDYSPTTMQNPDGTENPIAIGKHSDAADALIGLLDNCGVAIGQVGSGKTNLLNVVNAQTLRTTDTLVFHLDVTGAGVSLPWLRSWALLGLVDRPVIDWVAPTVAEARNMLTFCLEVIAARKRGYQDRMNAKNTDKLPIGPDVPEILIIVDEVAELPNEIHEMLDSVTNTGRAVRVRELICGLRATQDVITAAMKKQAKSRIGMFVTDPEELSHLFAGYQNLDTAEAPEPGTGFVSYLSDRARAFKAFRIKPEQINEIAVAVAGRRPAMDLLSVGVPSGHLYSSRWARTLPLLYPDAALAPAVESYLQSTGSVFLNSAPSTGPLTVVLTDPDSGETYVGSTGDDTIVGGDAMRDAILAAAAAFDTENTDGDDDPAGPETTTEEEIPQDLPKVDMTRLANWQDLALAYLIEAQADGISAADIADRLNSAGHPTTRQTVSGWLSRMAAKAEARQIKQGKNVVYVHSNYTHGA
ncbi:hypothetical protein [Kitasatospora sp. NPDC002965]|uniref:hypothetical protein n=1 Tax=Kitasatospora sp. NPDC002965 TaxID=3154775 RepID=UPI0033BE6B8E